jgi:hypothetical protein
MKLHSLLLPLLSAFALAHTGSHEHSEEVDPDVLAALKAKWDYDVCGPPPTTSTIPTNTA